MKKICPDCRQPLNQPQKPCGYVDGEPERIEFPGSNLVQLFASRPTPVWCATCEKSGRAQVLPAHRPRRDPTAARTTKTLRCHPDTWKRIEAEASRTRDGSGQVVDRLAAVLPLPATTSRRS